MDGSAAAAGRKADDDGSCGSAGGKQNSDTKPEPRKAPPRSQSTHNGNNNSNHNKKPKKSSRKRPRVQQQPSDGQQHRRPPPPPAPPAPLVKLLKSDPAVLTYFQSLHANLEADVQIWKRRAKQYQSENQQLQKKLKATKKHKIQKNHGKQERSQENNGKPNAAHCCEDDEEDESENASLTKKGVPPDNNILQPIGDGVVATAQESNKNVSEDGNDGDDGVPIEASMFTFESDESDEEDDNHDRKKGNGVGITSRKSPNENEWPFEDDTMEEKNTSTKADTELEKAMNAAFALESSDSSDDDDDNDEGKNGDRKPDANGTGQSTGGLTTTPSLGHTASLLREAFLALERLGVSLVEEKVVVDHDKIGDEDVDDTEQNETLQRCWIPRSDEDVVADMVLSIHNLSRVQLLHTGLMESHPPFVGPGLIPACNYVGARSDGEPCHPIVEGKEALFRSLIIMDTYCSQELFPEEEEWASLVQAFIGDGESENKDMESKIVVGMKGRARLVRHFIESLDGEITQCWPVHDRSDVFNNPAFHLAEEPQKGESDHYAVAGDVTETPNDEDVNALDSRIQGRLSNLVERALYVQFVVGFYLSQDDPNKVADLVWRYILSTVPCQSEELPKHQPVLSLVVLESMLVPQTNTWWWLKTNTDEEAPQPMWTCLFYGENEKSSVAAVAAKVLRLCLQLVGSVWRERERLAQNLRLCGLAKIEVAAYKRLARAGIATQDCLETWQTDTLFVAEEYCQELEGSGWEDHVLASRTYQLCLLLSERGTAGLLLDTTFSSSPHSQFTSKCQAVREMQVRLLDSRRSMIGLETEMSTPFEHFLSNVLDHLGSNKYPCSIVEELCCVLRGAIMLANGTLAQYCADTLVERSMTENGEHSNEKRFEIISLLSELSQIPTVRVINLRGRPDRMRAFHSQAMHHGLTVVHSLALLDDAEPSTSEPPGQDENFFGLHAFDGRGKWVDATERLSDKTGNRLKSFIDSHWRPHDLKVFDSNAPNSEGLVRTSPSEQACALSHLASWKGVLRSLRVIQQQEHELPSEPYQLRVLRRLFLVSGFAEGAALHASNKTMDPAPVCVILEDDAILVDRFSDRLGDVLRDLPRDFHFCSLGYSRSKTAPIVTFRKHVGIPTNLFYLTGYLISEAGADFLLQNLPIVGPVDSWIGLKMTGNFDNMFGNIVGIGRTKPTAEALAHKDLCMILKFRAFCAMVPLCSQRVGPSASAAGSTGRNWRQRDTDIEYSGGQVFETRHRRSGA